MLDTEDGEIDRHGAAFKRFFAILFIASMLKVTEKRHQYEDMCGVTSIKIVDVDVEQRGDIVLVKFFITFNRRVGQMEQGPNRAKLRDLL